MPIEDMSLGSFLVAYTVNHDDENELNSHYPTDLDPSIVWKRLRSAVYSSFVIFASGKSIAGYLSIL